MVYISKPLGRNAFGDKHDIAAIQAALKNIKIRNKPIWPGRIDGRKTKNLEEAIAIFQAAHRIKVTGKVEPRGPTITAMTRALPRNLANMRGLKGTCVVFVPTKGAREADQEARVTQAKAPLPDKEARGLATIIKKAGRELGICLGRKRDFVTPEGRFATELAPVGLKWIDPSSGRVATLNNPPREAMATILRLVPSGPEWQPGTASDLVCTSKRQVRALNCVPQLTTEAMNFVGITIRPDNDVLKALIAGIVRLVQIGDIQGPKGREDTKTMLEAADRADPPVRRKLEAAAQKEEERFSDDTRRNIEGGQPLLLSLLDAAIASLTGEPSPETLERLSKYFTPDPTSQMKFLSDIGEIAEFVRSNLQKAKVFLSQSPSTLFEPFPGRKVPPDVKASFDRHPNAVAVQGGRTIFIHQVNFGVFVKTPLQGAAVFMHEGMHMVLLRGDGDARYLSQGVEGLPILVALANADSYTAFVFHGKIEAAMISVNPTRKGP